MTQFQTRYLTYCVKPQMQGVPK